MIARKESQWLSLSNPTSNSVNVTTLNPQKRPKDVIPLSIWLFNSSPWENPPIFKFGKPSISINGPWLNHGELLPRGGLHWLAEAVESFGQNLLSHSDLRRRNRPRGFWTARDQEIRDHESWETGAVKKDMKNPCRYSNVIVNIYVYIYICIYYLPWL